MAAIKEVKISKQKLKTLFNDVVKSAEAVNLIYVTDKEPGITRLKSGDKFIYKFQGKTITDKAILKRIKSLVIPPAWTEVWICEKVNGHLQVTGLDAMKRKQYKYHSLWNSLRNHTKYFHLYDFGRALPSMRKQLHKDIALPELSEIKVLATVVSLMECTCIRIGNSVYEALHGSFGLTTLKDKHVKVEGNEMKFSFKGKKGVYHDITLKNKKLAKIVQSCRDIPGKELFQYYNMLGEKKSVDSGMVNNYIKKISGGNFTAKDFRTWSGSLHALLAFKELGIGTTGSETKNKVVAALDKVAKQLGNTRTVCKKYYVHPAVIDLYSDNSLEKYFNKIDSVECSTDKTELSTEENILMEILEKHGSKVVVGL